MCATRAVQVVARLRPPLDDRQELCTFANSEENHVDIVNFRNAEETLRYNFSQVFDQSASQEQVFSSTVNPLLDELFHGYNVSVLAYGPTGAGKTYTALGDINNPGIIQRSVTGILNRIGQQADDKSVQLSFSYLEIYNEKLIDLLMKESSDLQIREDSSRCIHVSGLSEKVISSYNDFSQNFGPASKRRTVASTKLNEHSSRSHCIIMLKVTQTSNSAPHRSMVSKLYIIDLAGSENNKQTGNRGIRLKESGAINNSLFVLGQVVEALNQNMARIPYRDSKLTRLLQDSFGGSSHAVVITNLAPELSHYMLTYTTLNFAQKTRTTINRPAIVDIFSNQDYQPVFKAPCVEVVEPDSSSVPPASQISLTPLRKALLSPIHHTREDISQLNQRLEKLESLMEITQSQKCEPVPTEEQEKMAQSAQEHIPKENLSPKRALKRIRQRFDWGSPLPAYTTDSPLDSRALFVQKQKPVRRKKFVSTAVTQTPARVKDVDMPRFEKKTNENNDVSKEHNEKILRILNEGDLKSLSKLSTLGAKRSNAIIDYRKFVGDFKEILDICKVPSFSKSFVEKFLKANYIDLTA